MADNSSITVQPLDAGGLPSTHLEVVAGIQDALDRGDVVLFRFHSQKGKEEHYTYSTLLVNTTGKTTSEQYAEFKGQYNIRQPGSY
jgi:hypothetical protein